MASDFSLRQAAHIIRNGGVIAYPTDTVYGLGCDPYNAQAVARLNDIKHRPANKQFILLAGHIKQIEPLAILDNRQKQKLQQCSEPTSWVLDASEHIPHWLCNDDHTISVRLSKHKQTQYLCQILGHAIISTSANISGKLPAKNSLQLHQRFHNTLDKIIATNEMLDAKPSKIIRLRDNFIIRQ